jgi:hypothetical protein
MSTALCSVQLYAPLVLGVEGIALGAFASWQLADPARRYLLDLVHFSEDVRNFLLF